MHAGTDLLASGAVESSPEEALILANLRNTIMVNRELRPEVMFLDDERCVQIITKASGASLATAFQQARTTCDGPAHLFL